MNPYTRGRKKTARRKVRKMRAKDDTLRREVRQQARAEGKAETRSAMDVAILQMKEGRA